MENRKRGKVKMSEAVNYSDLKPAEVRRLIREGKIDVYKRQAVQLPMTLLVFPIILTDITSIDTIPFLLFFTFHVD